MRAAALVLAAIVLASVVTWLSICRQRVAQSPDEALARACEFLWSQQAEDGGWHSEHYGLMRSGQSLTPFVLWALLDAPAEIVRPDEERVARAATFLVRHVGADGALGRADGANDYPNYATGLALRVLQRVGGHGDVIARMRDYLIGQQFAEALDWRPEDPPYGAWGMGGPPRRRPADPGHLDLSMTRVVLQGLADLDPRPQDALVRSRSFLGKCRNEDGGFFFSTVVLGANKGGRTEGGFDSYGSTTADGILALLASGLTGDDPTVNRAGEWLVRNHRTDKVPKIPEDIPARWAVALRFYYLAVSAEALAGLGVDEAPAGHDWRRELGRALVGSQRVDGSWVNPAGQVKEDDPLIATALAVRALTVARKE